MRHTTVLLRNILTLALLAAALGMAGAADEKPIKPGPLMAPAPGPAKPTLPAAPPLISPHGVPMLTEMQALQTRVSQLERQLSQFASDLAAFRREYASHRHGYAGLGITGTFEDRSGSGGALAAFGRGVYVLTVSGSAELEHASTTPPR